MPLSRFLLIYNPLLSLLAASSIFNSETTPLVKLFKFELAGLHHLTSLVIPGTPIHIHSSEPQNFNT